MEKRFKTIVAMLCALALVVTPAFPAWGAEGDDASSGEMAASDQTFVGVGSGKRIDTFKLGGLYSYESLGNDSDKPTLTLSTSALQTAVKEKLLPQWSGVAASIFRDQAGQLVDLYGYQPSGGNMSRAGFDAYFNMGKGGATTEYKNEVWSCYNLSHKLGQTHSSHAGNPGWDQFTVSGIKQVNSLSGARDMVGQALYDCENHKGLEAKEFLDVTENGSERLDALKSDDQTTAFANVVTSVNCKGSSADFDYVSFGIVFYDFNVVPVAAKNLKYITGGFSQAENQKAGQPSEIKNAQQQAIVHSAVLGDSVVETTSTTLSGLASFKLSENIGANIGWTETESESETEFWADKESAGASTSTSSESTSMGLNWGTAWEMAGALGAEQGHSKSVEVSKAVETTISLPPHTAATIDHSSSTTTLSQSYQQPAILNYKVAIFAASGDFYSGGSGGINSGTYEKQSLVIKFDTKDEATPFYGCAATDDLYSRVSTNKNVKNYDVSDGRTYSTHSSVSGWSKSEDIDWTSVMSNAQSYYGVDVAKNVAQKNFFLETPGKLNLERDKASSAAQSIYPLYDLASVKTPVTDFVLYSNNTLDRNSLPIQGYDKEGVEFYGFTSELGEWCRCDEKGNILNNGNLLRDDPVDIVGDALAPKTDENSGGTIHMIWVASQNNKPKTGEHPEGQDLANPRIASPVVTINVVNAGLDNPKVTAKGSYSGYYGTPINLNDVITYEVADSDDKVIETQVNWESREPVSRGIDVKAGTGDVTFTKPGTYNVRPYVVNNNKKKVYPEWITITATEHNFVHYDAKAPTNCAAGNADGWKEHYRCSDCGKYFSEAADSAEIPAADIVVEATGHDWGEWTTTRDASATEPGEQLRVCKNDDRHVEARNLYTVQFNANGHGTAPESQAVAQGVSASVPQEPVAAGYTFAGWFTDAACTQPYDFGATVTGNLTLYAKWSTAKRTIAIMAVGDVVEGADGELKIESAVNGSISFSGTAEGVNTVTEEGYTYYYKEVEFGAPVSLTVTPNGGYGLKGIQAIPVKPDSSMGEPFTPDKTGANTYSLTMPDADVAVMASFTQVKVTYDGNAPKGETASNIPAEEKIAYGGTPTKLTQTPAPTVSATSGIAYEFGGWFTDKACTKPYLTTSAITQDTTLYAKWIEAGVAQHTVTYTLLWEPDPADARDTGSYEESYQVEDGSTAYDPTGDLYAVAGKDLTAAYKLQGQGDACWFTNYNGSTGALTGPFAFATPITTDTHLYAKVVDRAYTVTYFNGSESLGTQSVIYNKPIGTIANNVATPKKSGYTFAGEWVTEDGMPWSIENNPVTSDLNLYASWPVNRFSVTFYANGHGSAPEKQAVEAGGKATEPEAPKATGYTFGGWFTDPECTKAYDFTASVTDDLKLHAKWTENAKPAEPAKPTITPATPAVKSVKSPLKNKVTVSWKAANNADGYEVSIGNVTANVKADKSSATVVNTKLKAGEKYSVKVRAWHMNGTVKTYGSWSPAKKVTISKYYNAKTKKKVKAYKKANLYSKKKATLKKGATVKVLKVSGKWAKTNKGWVLKKNLKAVKIVNTAAVVARAADPAAESPSPGSASSLMAARIG